MIEHFTNAILMERGAAQAMAQALQSSDTHALKSFRRGQRQLRVDGTDVVLNVRKENESGAHPRMTTILAGAGGMYGGGYSIVSGIAIIPIFGPLFKGYGDYGFADQAELRATVRAATMDRAVSGIMLYIDSPGGSVAGTKELADEVYAANAVKPVTVFAEDMLASAAFWIASSARAIYINQTGMAGSIGVVTQIIDASRAYEAAGIKVIPIVTGKFKNAGDPTQPATADSVSYIQDLINSLYAMFVSDVARGRGLSESAIRGMEAKIFIGANAKKAGLVNGVTTFDMAWDSMRRMADKNYRSAVQQNEMWRARLKLMELDN